jgi:Spy/CpxP family protein refolding chaperone
MRATTRRDFIKSVGIATASLVMARCIPFGGKDDSPQGHLRNCWLRLDWLPQQTQEDFERGDQALDELVTDHRAALNDLVTAGGMDTAVANQKTPESATPKRR